MNELYHFSYGPSNYQPYRYQCEQALLRGEATMKIPFVSPLLKYLLTHLFLSISGGQIRHIAGEA